MVKPISKGVLPLARQQYKPTDLEDTDKTQVFHGAFRVLPTLMVSGYFLDILETCISKYITKFTILTIFNGTGSVTLNLFKLLCNYHH